MKARDVMVSPVITVNPSSTVREVAKTFVERGISAAPVLDTAGKVVGIVSEGDLLHRAETGTERRRPWWMRALAGTDNLAVDYIRSHARKISDIMSREVVMAAPETPLHEIAELMERHAIKRIPIVANGQLVGIVSRANLVQAVASTRKGLEVPLSDRTIRDKLFAQLGSQPWAHTALLNVTVAEGIVDLWGMTNSEMERKAIRVLAESTPGVCAVNDNLVVGHVQGWT
jgi:CBS domain-containing protein